MEHSSVPKLPRRRISEYIWSVAVAYKRMRQVREVKATLLLLAVLLSAGWLVFALEPVFTSISHLVGHLLTLFGFSWPEAATWPSWVDCLDWVVPLVLFLGLLTWVRRSYLYGGQENINTALRSPEPRVGLIVMLSKFYPVDATRLNVRPAADKSTLDKPAIAAELARVDVPQKATDLKALLDSSNPTDWEHLRLKLFATSWGTLAAAVERHRQQLRYCWIISTAGADGTAHLAPLAARLIQSVAINEVACAYDEYVVPNGYDIDPVVKKVDEIYASRLPSLILPVYEVIADFTGGTAAMTAGMILATLAPERSIEYLRQDAFLVTTDGSTLYAISPDELEADMALAEVITHPDILPNTE